MLYGTKRQSRATIGTDFPANADPMIALSSSTLGKRHLDIAFVMWLLGVLGGAAVGMAFSHMGYDGEGLALALTWLVNLGVAWHLANAAQAQGRRRWLWGMLAAIWPAASMGVCSFLNFSRWFGWSKPPA
jgi:hypothetical protein